MLKTLLEKMEMNIPMKCKRIYAIALSILILAFVFPVNVFAEPGISITQDGINIGTAQNPKDVAASIQVLLLLTVLSLAPSILIMMTCFTRIIVVLSFLRSALGTQQMPPNQVLIGLALFLTMFIMTPVGKELNEKAYQPFSKGEIEQKVALDNASGIMRGFMLKQMDKSEKSQKDLELFVTLAKIPVPVKAEELPMTVVIPAFLISELRIAFQIGFLIYIPFLIIDMVVSSTLMSMGMMMLPPVMISLPFKILLFIMAGGWNLVVKSIINTFAM